MEKNCSMEDGGGKRFIQFLFVCKMKSKNRFVRRFLNDRGEREREVSTCTNNVDVITNKKISGWLDYCLNSYYFSF